MAPDKGATCGLTWDQGTCGRVESVDIDDVVAASVVHDYLSEANATCIGSEG